MIRTQSEFDDVLRLRCISCHATVSSADCEPSGTELPDSLLADGVSCTACHGPAVDWLQAHTAADWNPTKAVRKTETVFDRANTCVRCHIGSRSDQGLKRDVNHDLIAAGHPALRFDLLIFHENLPVHWNTRTDTEDRFNSSSVRIRHIGQRVNMAAAAKLSAERAADNLAGGDVPWPELADYDCFSCHQTLTKAKYLLPSESQEPIRVSTGLPVWNPWNTNDRLLWSRNYQPMPPLSPRQNAADVQSIAKTLSTRIRDELKNTVLPTNAESLRILKETMNSLRDRPPPSWHEAAAQYLMLDAVYRDLTASQRELGRVGKDLKTAIENLEMRLRFDQRRSMGVPAAFDSPAEFDPDGFRRAARELASDMFAILKD